MKKEFIPYDIALALKELGFDEPCLAKYDVPGNLITSGCYSDSSIVHLIIEQNDICEAHTLAPLYQQAFRWFREKYGLHLSINVKDSIWYFERFSIKGFKTYEEAEFACLKKLIELVKEKK